MRKGTATWHLFLLLIIIAVFIWSAVKPSSYLTWSMEVLPAVIGLIIALAIYDEFRLTSLSYLIIAILAILMFVGGHYTYSRVPLFDWLKDIFDWDRNHYDRFGHLLKGLSAIVIREILLRKTPLRSGGWLHVITVSIMLAISALYEIVEWLASKVTKGGKAAKDFLGTQGDIWDTQWDMSFLVVGSVLSLIFLTKLHNRQLNRIAPHADS